MPQPRVPNWIRSYVPPPGWTNVFQLVPSNKHLYGTETLFGDWNGRTLLLAKDGAPTHIIRALRDRGESRPWRHAQRTLGDPGGWKTNELIEQLASRIPGGKLYGSATANLLCDDPSWSRTLPGFYHGPLHDYLKRVLVWVLGKMANLDQIACLGEHAWYLTCHVLGKSDNAKQWSHYRDRGEPILAEFNGKKVLVHSLYHPAARVSHASTRTGWNRLIHPESIPAVTNLHVTARLKAGAPTTGTAQAGKSETIFRRQWIPLNVTRAQQIPKAKGRIRPRMVEVLLRAGESGASYAEFVGLDWQGGLYGKKLDKAMCLLCSQDGYKLEYSGARGSEVVWWRLAPGYSKGL